ncbi:hypothetical protein WDV93_23580 [Pantoea ananatis]
MTGELTGMLAEGNLRQEAVLKQNDREKETVSARATLAAGCCLAVWRGVQAADMWFAAAQAGEGYG